MTDKKQVHAFAEKWISKFKDSEINFVELVDHFLADDCENLGFKMDCGDAFGEKYGCAVSNSDELARVINCVTDVDLLGSAIYSRWRYFNHHAYDARQILEQKSIEWFVIAFGRLIELSE